MNKNAILRILNEAKTEKMVRTGGKRNLLQEMYDKEVVAIHPAMIAAQTPSQMELLWTRWSPFVTRASLCVSIAITLILGGTNGAVLHDSLLVWIVFGLLAFGSAGTLFIAEKLDGCLNSEQSP